ncbi:MAG: RNA polymerase sigma factor [Woeseiaceae bacterium]|nr:RNA polymerase sigma factor [Woeseiaceae bacterium]
MDGQPDDTALMLRYGAGDAGAFEVLYRRHNDALYRYLLRLCNNRDTAADLFQEAWSKVIKARSRYRPTARFNTWLYRIARNCFIDHLRRNKRYGDGPPDDPDSRAAPGPGPDIGAEQARAREKLLAILETLPMEQRDAFLLREEAGLSVDDIATMTGVGHETVKSRLRYATRKLRAAFDDKTEPAA